MMEKGSTMNKKLEILYEQMSQLTAPVCANYCRAPHSCCDRMYCEIAADYAKEQGVTLIRTGHPTLPFMSAQGCTIPPHLRPICTLHVCCVNSLGFKPNDPKWTKEYFELREEIDTNTEER
jgi:hypothetical protein